LLYARNRKGRAENGLLLPFRNCEERQIRFGVVLLPYYGKDTVGESIRGLTHPSPVFILVSVRLNALKLLARSRRVPKG
jgi:hypothetical protein